MKPVTVCILMAILLAALTGCVTPKVSSLSSQSFMSSASSVNPALVQPYGGLHPYASASFSAKSEIDDREESIEDFRAGTVTVGLNYHDELEKRTAFVPFVGGALSGSIVSYDPRFLENEYEAIQAESIDADGDFIDYSVEIVVKPGLLLKLHRFLASVYCIGIGRYEDGPYASLRNDLDGIEDMYNLADNAWSYGFGIGEDIQFGTPGSFDVGLNGEITTMFNRTQSISSEYLEGDSDARVVAGGDAFSHSSFTFGPYIDFRHWRCSITWGTSDISTVKVVWRL